MRGICIGYAILYDKYYEYVLIVQIEVCDIDCIKLEMFMLFPFLYLNI